MENTHTQHTRTHTTTALHTHTQTHATTVARVREAVQKVKSKSVAIALDTKGPEIRTGLLKGVSNIYITLLLTPLNP